MALKIKNTNIIIASGKRPGTVRKDTIISFPLKQDKHRKNKIAKDKKLSFRASINSKRKINIKKKVKLEELYIFAGQLSTLLDAGVPLILCLNILTQQTEDKHFKFIIERIIEDITAGTTLTLALSKYPNIFSPLYISMIRAGEKSGKMVQILKQLSVYLQEQDKLAKKLKAAIVYPRFVFFFFLFVLLAIIFGLVPKFKSIFESFNAQLPWPTQILLNISQFAKDHLIVEILIIVSLVFLLKHYKKTKAGRYYWDRLKLKIPMMGDLVLKSALSKFCRTLSILIQSGVSMVESLEIAGETAQNILFTEALKNIKRGVIEGASLHNKLNQNTIFPPLVVKMVSVGEESGALDKMLIKISEIYDAHVDSKISGLSSVIEPVLMAGLGAVALIVIIALYLPIFKMSSVISY